MCRCRGCLFFTIRKAGLETGGGEAGAEGSQKPQVLLSSKQVVGINPTLQLSVLEDVVSISPSECWLVDPPVVSSRFWTMSG